MRQYWGKITAVLLSLSMAIGLCCPVSAAPYDAQEDGYIYVDHSNEYSLSSDEAEIYSCFEFSIDADQEVAPASDISIKDYILSLCTLSSEYDLFDYHIASYESEDISALLYDCDSISEIMLIDDVLYITYFTSNGVEVHLGYDDTGLTEKVVYYPESDTAIIQNMGTTTQHDGFRAGCSSEISDELKSKVDQLIEEQNWEALSNLDCIDWELDTTDTDDSSALSATRAGGVFGFTSDAAMLANLKSDFPMKVDSQILRQSKYTSILSKNYTVKVLENRNGYVRITSNWANFVASTAITAISTYLAIKTTATISILDALGIQMGIVDGVNMIKESVKLYRSAKYEYFGARDGYVFDDTLYNNFVHVIFHSGDGEFTGGYTSSGVFTWVESVRSSAYDYSADSIANKALEYYAKNVYADGYCSVYSPD